MSVRLIHPYQDHTIYVCTLGATSGAALASRRLGCPHPGARSNATPRQRHASIATRCTDRRLCLGSNKL